jgi:RNA polymerase sigma-70 factor (ECF subfamily)
MGQKLSERKDEEIARLAQSGNVEVFGILIKRYEEKMTRYGRKFLSGFEDIEDIVQDIFIKAYENIQSFDIKRKFSPWLYRIAHNEFVNALKKHKKRPLSFFELDIILPYLMPEEFDKEDDRQKIKQIIDKCLDKLDPKYREPIILYYLEELNYKEISDILHIPVSTVGIRLKRAKEKLKNKINEQE